MQCKSVIFICFPSVCNLAVQVTKFFIRMQIAILKVAGTSTAGTMSIKTVVSGLEKNDDGVRRVSERRCAPSLAGQGELKLFAARRCCWLAETTVISWYVVESSYMTQTYVVDSELPVLKSPA